jgi:hypothetical protein
MDLIGSLFIFAGIAVVSYAYAKRKRIEQEATVQGQGTGGSQQSQLNVVKEELERRKRILERVEKFVKGSKLVEPIAKWKNDTIYKYVFNDGYLYEFEDILVESNQRIGIDEEYLCFKQVCYKRVNNPLDFMEKFGKDLNLQ